MKDIPTLQLANGDTWHVAPGDATCFQETNAALSTLGLHRVPFQNCRGRFTVISSVVATPENDNEPPLASLDPEIRERLPEAGWRYTFSGGSGYWRHEETGHSILEAQPGCPVDERIELLLRPVFIRVVENGGVLIHAALLALGNAGVLISAPGQTGKSTCSRRVPPPWQALGDDRAIVLPVADGTYRVHPVPTISALRRDPQSQWRMPTHAQLRLIAFLEQAATPEQEAAFPISSGRASILLNSQSVVKTIAGTWIAPPMRKEFATQVFHQSNRILGDVPRCILRAHIEGRFWDHLEGLIEASCDHAAWTSLTKAEQV